MFVPCKSFHASLVYVSRAGAFQVLNFWHNLLVLDCLKHSRLFWLNVKRRKVSNIVGHLVPILTSYRRGRLSAVELLTLKSFRSTLKLIFTFFTKQATSMRRSTVLSLSLLLVFSVITRKDLLSQINQIYYWRLFCTTHEHYNCIQLR